MSIKSTSANSFSKGIVLIAANDPLIEGLLVDAINIMGIFAGVIKSRTTEIEKISKSLDKVSLILCAFDHNQDGLQFLRSIRAEEFSAAKENPAAMVWSTLAITNDEISMARKMGVELFIPRPFLIEKVVEELLKLIKIS